jgi:hypothetical protein
MKKLILLILLIASTATAGGLYDQVTTPIAGEILSYRRSPQIQVNNQLNQPVTLDYVTETVKLYPDGEIVKSFLRRVPLAANDYVGKNIPLLNPQTGEQMGAFTTDLFYAMVYSSWILAEKQADGLVRTEGATIYYVTNGSEVVQ